MTDTTDAPPTTDARPTTIADLAARLAADVERLDHELGEVDALITQARTESTRHEGRRTAAADKVAAFLRDGDGGELAELDAQLLNLTKRAALMESQVDVLDGKRRALARHREALATLAEMTGGIDPTIKVEPSEPAPVETSGRKGASAADAEPSTPPAVSRLVLTAQEDLRREIARAMHDGPAQSLTNIVLQAQIVERLVAQDPASATSELRQLIGMVQQTLEATKTFIFDVRPMVLDDLGLVPTLRRWARERGRKADVPVEFETMGADRRLAMDLESGLFRILDEALVAYLDRRPTAMTVRLEWSADGVEAVMTAAGVTGGTAAAAAASVEAPLAGADLPPALAAMMEERRSDARDAAEAARKRAMIALPAPTWREIQVRASTMGMHADLRADGSELHLVVDAPIDDER
jgi:two-component system sensor histidine kinase DegS